MKRLMLAMVVMLAVGCGDERGGDGGKEVEKPDPTVVFDVDTDTLDEDCIYTPENSDYPDWFEHYEEMFRIEATDGNTFRSEPFTVDSVRMIREHRDAAGIEATSAVQYSQVGVGIVSFTHPKAGTEFILYEHINGEVIENSKFSVKVNNLGMFEFENLEPSVKGTYSVEVIAKGDFLVVAGLKVSGHYVNHECLQPAN